MFEICTDHRFKIINAAKQDLLKSTNIDTSPKEMEVLDNFLFRCWQMGWLDRYVKKEVPDTKVGEWIPADQPPETDDFILLSFENFTIPMVGRYERYQDGSGNYYLGDCNEEDTCLANNLFVNGWQPLPERYNPEPEKPHKPNWKEAMMRTFLGRNT